MPVDDEFEELIGQFGEPTPEPINTPEGVGIPQQGENAHLDELPEAPEGTPVLDQLAEWDLDGDVVRIHAAHPMLMFIAVIASELADGHTALNPMSRLDIEAGDLRYDSMSLRADELLTGAQRGLAALVDLLTGELPVAGLFDASRGAQTVRLALLTGEFTLTGLEIEGEKLDIPAEAHEEVIAQFSMIAGGLTGDLITLATA